MCRVFRKQYARPRRDCGLEPDLGSDAEFPRARRRAVTHRIAEMSRTPAECRVNRGGAYLHLATYGFVARLLEHQVIDRVRADRCKRIAGDFADFVPSHAEFVADGVAIHSVACTAIAHRVAQFALALQAAEPPVNVLEQLVFSLRRMAIEAAILAVHHQREP